MKRKVSVPSCTSAAAGTSTAAAWGGPWISMRTGVPAGSRVGAANSSRTVAAPVAGSTAAGRLITVARSGSSPGPVTWPGLPTFTCASAVSGTWASICKRLGSIRRRIGSAAAASTRSPGLWPRAATTPANGARTTWRPASWAAAAVALRAAATAAAASASSRCASSSSLRAATPRWNRPPMRCSAARAVVSRAWALARAERRSLASASRDGMSNRTSRSPRLTRSPTPFGIAAMRAGCGALTSSSAPVAGLTVPVAATCGRISPRLAGRVTTGTRSSVCTSWADGRAQAATAAAAPGSVTASTASLASATREPRHGRRQRRGAGESPASGDGRRRWAA